VTGAFLGQVAVVTGAGSGIGRAITRNLADQGASVYLVGRTREKLEATALSLGAAADKAVVVPMDVSIDENIDALKQRLESVGLDILVLSAGEYCNGPIQTLSVDALDTLYRTNVRANYRLAQAMLPMLKKRPGQFVFINSSTGLAARAQLSQLSSTNHALKALADALRAEVNPDHVRVLSVYPGRTATPRLEALYAKNKQEYRPELLLQPEDVAAVVVNALMLPRTAEVTDISIRPLMKSY
jgi:NADP-dependent 3-hydroxy acid dehydrogenase YdfG